MIFSLQGETGRPGMPGEKGDLGAMVGGSLDLIQHQRDLPTHIISPLASGNLDRCVIQMIHYFFYCLTGQRWRSRSCWLQWNEGKRPDDTSPLTPLCHTGIYYTANLPAFSLSLFGSMQMFLT